jgi:hypothetical protein
MQPRLQIKLLQTAIPALLFNVSTYLAQTNREFVTFEGLCNEGSWLVFGGGCIEEGLAHRHDVVAVDNDGVPTECIVSSLVHFDTVP